MQRRDISAALVAILMLLGIVGCASIKRTWPIGYNKPIHPGYRTVILPGIRPGEKPQRVQVPQRQIRAAAITLSTSMSLAALDDSYETLWFACKSAEIDRERLLKRVEAFDWAVHLLSLVSASAATAYAGKASGDNSRSESITSKNWNHALTADPKDQAIAWGAVAMVTAGIDSHVHWDARIDSTRAILESIRKAEYRADARWHALCVGTNGNAENCGTEKTIRDNRIALLVDMANACGVEPVYERGVTAVGQTGATVSFTGTFQLSSSGTLTMTGGR